MVRIFPRLRRQDRSGPPGDPLAGIRWWVMSGPPLVVLVLPLVALLLRTDPGAAFESLRRPVVHQAVILSLWTSLAATGATVLFGLPLAFLMARRRFPLHRAVDTLIELPVVLPPAVAGVALLMAFGRRGLLGEPLAEIGVQLPFTPAAVILAQMFVAAPLFIRSAMVGLAGVPAELEEAARIDGASTGQVLRHVTLPLARNGLIGGAVMTWARALGEFGATIIFAGNLPGRTQTMPLAIYLGFEIDLQVALTLSVLLMGASFLTLILVKYVLLR